MGTSHGLNWHEVSLCVEDPLIEIDLKNQSPVKEDITVTCSYLVSVSEEEVEVLQGLPQEVRLHLVPGHRVVSVQHVVNGGVAVRHLCVFLKTLEKVNLK